MLKARFRKFLSFFCCICFISSFVSDIGGSIVKAATSGTINVIGYSSIDGNTCKYEENGSPSGTMTASYMENADSSPVTCTPDTSGKITGVPTGANVTFVLTPESGFTPSLKIGGTPVTVSEVGDGQYTGIMEMPSSDINVEAVFSSLQTESDEKNIVLSLKYVEDGEIKDGTYNDDFKSKWATIEYSADGGTTYSELDQGTTINEDGAYVFDESIDSVSLRTTWTNKIMAALDGKLLESGADVPLAKGEHVALFQDAVYTVVWLYTSVDGVDESAITKHGKVSIEKGDGIDGQEDNTGGVYAVEPGTEVTMHFTPDYGYQFKMSTVGEGVEVTPGSDECSYTFTMPESYVVIGDIFTENPDTVNVLVDSIDSANLLNASSLISSGNTELTITDAIMTGDTKDEVVSAASEKNLEPVAYFGMELNKFLTKGATGENWETMLSTTNSPAKVELALADDLKGANSYTVMRVDGSDVTYLDTTYNSDNGTLQFETDTFSVPYAICVDSASGGAVVSAGKVLTGDQNKLLLYSLIAIAAVTGFIFTFRFTRRSKSKKQ